ncbi:MAG TPA: DUF4136 domain-containing protein [Cyclobacteriaceae bacterium]|nr:DUF4136 domain-containing protein [Cyclobacteriaceae bacterium]
MRNVIVILSIFTLLGCGTQPQLSELVNDMVVLTNFPDNVDYKQYVKYAMPLDTIGLSSNTSTNEYLANDYAKMITNQIKRNLDQTNHTWVADDKDADFGVSVLVVNDLSVFQSFYPGPGYYYPSYYGYGGYGGYYGGYGYSTYNYFQQAILVIEFVDLKNSNGTESIWVANIGDLINSYDTSQKTKEAIDQAFDQSPFLER